MGPCTVGRTQFCPPPLLEMPLGGSSGSEGLLCASARLTAPPTRSGTPLPRFLGVRETTWGRVLTFRLRPQGPLGVDPNSG